ncbi:hypothetical protein LTR05_003234 [Lithohypha guttulata]|uniref:Annexin n=1 Tax=Lithohypha guttulata TaxID=1690604 RepID=A0AAN7YD35_9EURO|nr:hypothetical protein LTR05_003234 [Lithohypha guttulata]
MFSNLHAPRGDRARSKSPGGRTARASNDHFAAAGDDRRHRKPSRSKYSESESEGDDYPEPPQYEDRTPDAYNARSDKENLRRQKEENEYEYSKKGGNKYAASGIEDVKTAGSRKGRDPYADYAGTPQYARGNGTAFTNGDSLQYAAFPGTGTIPGGFPGQSVKPPPSPQPRPIGTRYEDVGKVRYAQIDPNSIQYNYNNGTRQPSYAKAYDGTANPTRPPGTAQRKAYNDDNYATREPVRPAGSRHGTDERVKTLGESGRRQSYHRERSKSPAPGNPAGFSTEQLRKSLGRLSTSGVSGANLGVAGASLAGGSRPPASPLLEAYKGTYQTISPLPSPLTAASGRRDEEAMSDFDLSDSDDSDEEISQQIKALKRERQGIAGRNGRSPKTSDSRLETGGSKARRLSSNAMAVAIRPEKKKAVSFYNPDKDAEKIAEALKGNHRTPDVKPLLKILPWLTTDEITTLKTAYKNFAKINGQGINLSKHIKARFPGGNLGKVLYATSLGRYEGDAYWANCFYQSGASRRELLIESLCGHSNETIHQIKDVFKDKRYDDDLEKCMKAELKADKFRFAILLALEERRQPEGLGINMRDVHEDGEDLRDALAGAGGETAMIKIIMTKSDDHLREVMRYYEKSYKRNFARDMISKSQNLVGEVLAHIINGALNRPMRDAMLLHQAIEEFAPPAQYGRSPSPTASKPSAGRAELLISRVVRLHWDSRHLEKVKRAYEERYRETVVNAIRRDVQGGMKTDDGKAWAAFCMDLIRSSEA